jgi:hypothetical protein
MDGGNGLNLIYLDTFEGLGLARDQLQNSLHPFYGVASSKQSIPLEQITLLVTFRDASNYCTEMLTFEVVDFSDPYHVILGLPCYIKFIAIPSYTYLKLKILGQVDIITMEAKTQRALDREQSSIELSAVAVAATELKEMCLSEPPSSINPSMSSMPDSFKVAKDAKIVQIDAEDLAKTVQIGACLSLK